MLTKTIAAISTALQDGAISIIRLALYHWAMLTKTIAAISTALQDGAISIIRLSGPDALAIADSVFSGDVLHQPANTIRYGTILKDGEPLDEVLLSVFRAPHSYSGMDMVEINAHGVLHQPANTIRYGTILKDGEPLDEVLLSVFRAPHSYSGMDMVEINAHGGVLITRRILQLLLSKGAVLAEPGEFTRQAFLTGRIDLAQAEAVNDMITATSDAGARIAVQGIRGSVRRLLEPLIDDILNIIAQIEVNIDYPEYEDVEELTSETLLPEITRWIDRIGRILERAAFGQQVKKGIDTVILGRPNAGKSSLLNALLEEDKAIVTDGIRGSVRRLLEPLIDDILNIIAQIEVNIDYPEYEDVEELTSETLLPEITRWIDRIGRILERATFGQQVKKGIDTVILGRPNAGKSSLLNALLEEDKAIVTDIPGILERATFGQQVKKGIDTVILGRPNAGKSSLLNALLEEDKAIVTDIPGTTRDVAFGQQVKKGIDTVILGRPNAGKSSLLNALLEEDKAIVTDIPGTTRDVVEGRVILDGIQLNLLDTAGIRETEDTVEKLGVERSRKAAREADLVILVRDPLATDADLDLPELVEGKQLIEVWNKSDVAPREGLSISAKTGEIEPLLQEIRAPDLDLPELVEGKQLIEVWNKSDVAPREGLSISAKTGEIEPLLQEIRARFEQGLDTKEALLSSERQIGLLRRAQASMMNAQAVLQDGGLPDMAEIDIQEAHSCLKEILGEVHREDLLDALFSRFCLGK